MMGGRSEKFEKPKVVPAFLPLDAPLKETQVIDFGSVLQQYVRKGKEDEIKELSAGLTSARNMVIWALDRDRRTLSTDEIMEKVIDYVRILRGFVAPPAGVERPAAVVGEETTIGATSTEEEEDKKVLNKKEDQAKTLRFVVSYVWRDLLDVKGRDWSMQDVALEEASVHLAVSQKLLSRAAREMLSESNSVEMHATLRRVAGMLAEARRLVTEAELQRGNIGDDDDAEEKKEATKTWVLLPGTTTTTKKEKKIDSAHRASVDLRLALPEAWAQLSLAEAQTATLAKAFSSPHLEWSLLASLCSDQVQRYGTNVKNHVEALVQAAPDAANVKEWAGKRVSHNFLKAHIEFKRLYFTALARYCLGAPLLETAIAETDESLNSKALAELKSALSTHRDAMSQASAFVSTAKNITYVHDPTTSLQDSVDLVKRAFDRANQLDASIFHRGPASELGVFPLPKSLITAIPFPDPGISSLWTVAVWNAFDPEKVPQDGVFEVASGSRDCCLIS